MPELSLVRVSHRRVPLCGAPTPTHPPTPLLARDTIIFAGATLVSVRFGLVVHMHAYKTNTLRFSGGRREEGKRAGEFRAKDFYLVLGCGALRCVAERTKEKGKL